MTRVPVQITPARAEWIRFCIGILEGEIEPTKRERQKAVVELKRLLYRAELNDPRPSTKS